MLYLAIEEPDKTNGKTEKETEIFIGTENAEIEKQLQLELAQGRMADAVNRHRALRSPLRFERLTLELYQMRERSCNVGKGT